MSNQKRTSPNQYRTAANGEYGICTCQLHAGDWIATTHEFRAFGKTEPEALAKLGCYMKEAGDSIVKLANILKEADDSIVRAANKRQGNTTRCCDAPVEMIGLIDQARCATCLRINPEMQQAQTPKHPTDPPHCRTCGEYGCTKHNKQEAPIES